MKSLLVNVDAYRRIRLYPEGGLQLEAKVDGIGWILDNDAEVSDSVIGAYLETAIAIVQHAAENFRP